MIDIASNIYCAGFTYCPSIDILGAVREKCEMKNPEWIFRDCAVVFKNLKIPHS